MTRLLFVVVLFVSSCASRGDVPPLRGGEFAASQRARAGERTDGWETFDVRLAEGLVGVAEAVDPPRGLPARFRAEPSADGLLVAWVLRPEPSLPPGPYEIPVEVRLYDAPAALPGVGEVGPRGTTERGRVLVRLRVDVE